MAMTMGNLWRTFFGYSDDHAGETYDEAVARARHEMQIGNYEDAYRVLRYAERQRHVEAMRMLADCYWHGWGVREDAGRAQALRRRAAAIEVAATSADTSVPSV